MDTQTKRHRDTKREPNMKKVPFVIQSEVAKPTKLAEIQSILSLQLESYILLQSIQSLQLEWYIFLGNLLTRPPSQKYLCLKKVLPLHIRQMSLYLIMGFRQRSLLWPSQAGHFFLIPFCCRQEVFLANDSFIRKASLSSHAMWPLCHVFAMCLPCDLFAMWAMWPVCKQKPIHSWISENCT